VSDSAQYFLGKRANLKDGSREQFSAKPDGLPASWARCLAGQGVREPFPPGGTDMHPEELMKPDLLSEVVLLAFGTLVVTSLVLFVMSTFARS
jgi:hypothetical protein